jgi:lipopolysaccharide heptosyltransferase II
MKILFITLSNIGDVILSLPSLDRLLAVYPKAQATVVCGERAAGIFEDNFYIKRCIAVKGKTGIGKRFALMCELKKDAYDLIVDLKNSALPLFLKARHKTYPWFNAPGDIVHMSQRHLYKVKKFTRAFEIAQSYEGTIDGGAGTLRKALCVSGKDRAAAQNSLYDAPDWHDDKFILISPGARSHIKRWPVNKFAELADRLIRELGQKIIIVGDEGDAESCAALKKAMSSPAANLCAKTSLKSLAALTEKARAVISNDSAVMHLASYLGRPVIAIFGPTDSKKYGPWSSFSFVVRGKLNCSPCQAAQCKIGTLKCMDDISVDEVYAAVRRLLEVSK